MTPVEVFKAALKHPECGMLDHLEYLRDVSCGNVLEIGTNTGQSTSAFLLNANHVYSVDVNPDCAKNFDVPNWTFIHADSREISKVLDAIGRDTFFDVLFIDGDHSYECAASDLVHYSTLVKSGGIILMHDVVNVEFPGVRRAFDRFVRATGRRYVIHGGSYGLGVIFWDNVKYNIGL